MNIAIFLARVAREIAHTLLTTLQLECPSAMSNTHTFDAHKLTLIFRLEAATSRLEDMVPNYGDTSATTNGGLPLSDGGADAAAGTDQTRGNESPERPTEHLPPAIEDFDTIINMDVQTFHNMSEDIGGLIAEQVEPGVEASGCTCLLTTIVSVCWSPESFCRTAQIPTGHYEG